MRKRSSSPPSVYVGYPHFVGPVQWFDTWKEGIPLTYLFCRFWARSIRYWALRRGHSSRGSKVHFGLAIPSRGDRDWQLPPVYPKQPELVIVDAGQIPKIFEYLRTPLC